MNDDEFTTAVTSKLLPCCHEQKSNLVANTATPNLATFQEKLIFIYRDAMAKYFIIKSTKLTLHSSIGLVSNLNCCELQNTRYYLSYLHMVQERPQDRQIYQHQLYKDKHNTCNGCNISMSVQATYKCLKNYCS